MEFLKILHLHSVYMMWNFSSFIKKAYKTLENWDFFSHESKNYIYAAVLRVYVLPVLWALFLITPHFSLTKAIFNKIIQKRFLNYRENRELKEFN